MAHSWMVSLGTNGGGQPAAARRRTDDTAVPEIKEEMLLVTKAALQSLHKHRAAENCLYRAMKGKTQHAIFQAMFFAGKNYPDLVKRLGKGHTAGPPEMHVWMAAFFAAKDVSELPLDLRGKFIHYYNKCVSPKAIAKSVKSCKCTVQFDRQCVKLQWCVIGSDNNDHKIAEGFLLSALETLGFEEFEGMAPRSNLERQMQAYVDAHPKML